MLKEQLITIPWKPLKMGRFTKMGLTIECNKQISKLLFSLKAEDMLFTVIN